MTKRTATAESPSTALAVVEPTTNALAVSSTAVVGDRRGKDNLTSDDVIIPRLAIAQSMSPQLKRHESVYNPELSEGDLFNTVTDEIYSGPVTIAIIALAKRAAVCDSAGRVIERNVDWYDPRCEFSGEVDEKGKRLKPIADRFYDYIVALVDEGEPTGELAVISLKRTGIKVAKKLNGLLQNRMGATWEGLFTVAPVPDRADSFSFHNYKIRPAGPSTPAVSEFCERAYAAYKATPDRYKVDEKVVEGEVTNDANEDVTY